MRLSPDQTRVILHCVRQEFGAQTEVKLFGSRLDDTARGGDVDLLVETEHPPTLRQRALATIALEQALNLPVDIVVRQRGTQGGSFSRVVVHYAQALEASTSNPPLPFSKLNPSASAAPSC